MPVYIRTVGTVLGPYLFPASSHVSWARYDTGRPYVRRSIQAAVADVATLPLRALCGVDPRPRSAGSFDELLVPPRDRRCRPLFSFENLLDTGLIGCALGTVTGFCGLIGRVPGTALALAVFCLREVGAAVGGAGHPQPNEPNATDAFTQKLRKNGETCGMLASRAGVAVPELTRALGAVVANVVLHTALAL